jgi:hypothetical protein
VRAGHVGHRLLDGERKHGAARARSCSRRVVLIFSIAPSAAAPKAQSAARLPVMCGGEEKTFEAARPLLEAMGQTVRWFGAERRRSKH